MDSGPDKVHLRSLMDTLIASLANKYGNDLGAENEVRYKLVVDPSEDESLIRQLFTFGVLKRETTRVLACTKFPGDQEFQKVCELLETWLSFRLFLGVPIGRG